MPSFLTRILDLLFPPLCLNCDSAVGGNQTLCPACWKAIHFIAPPWCAVCGAPFEVPVEPNTVCGECLAFPPDFTRAHSAMVYDDASRRLILSFKHSDRLHPVRAMADWMRRNGAELWQTADIIIPVPLHRWRLFKRRYNQAALLAQELGKLLNKPVAVDALQRIKATASQGHLNREQRRQNIAGAFRLAPRTDVKGKTVVLVDDVLTTGATVNACSRVLLKAGATAVYVATLARTRAYRS